MSCLSLVYRVDRKSRRDDLICCPGRTTGSGDSRRLGSCDCGRNEIWREEMMLPASKVARQGLLCHKQKVVNNDFELAAVQHVERRARAQIDRVIFLSNVASLFLSFFF